MAEILVVGSLAYDSIESPAGKVDRALGGSANYFSLAASLSAPVRVVGVVGEDYAKSDIELLKARGVDTSGMAIVPGKTFHWEGYYKDDLNEAITRKTELNVFEHFNPQLPAKFRDSKFVFLANISPDLQEKVLDQVADPLFIGMDTMNYWISSKLADLKKVLKKTDIILINEGEAMMLTQSHNGIEAAARVCELGPKTVVIKRGEYGFMLYDQSGGFFILPAMPISKVVDPTGAGDTFAGGFFGYLAGLKKRPELNDLKRACIYGTMLASFTIQDFGVKALAKVTKKDVDERLAIYGKVILAP